MARRRRRRNLFKKSLIIYVCLLGVLCVILAVYIYFTLVSYESNQTGNFLTFTVRNLDDETLKGYLKEAKKDENQLDNYKKIVKSNKMQYSKVSEGVFEASLNNRKVFTIETKVVDTKTKLAFFSYQVREVTKITPYLERGFVYYDVTVPSNFKIYLDDKEVEGIAGEEQKYNDLDFMYYNESMPKVVTYSLNDVDTEKKVTVKDFMGQEVELKQDTYKYELGEYYIAVNDYNDLNKYLPNVIDVSDAAHNWSLFMSNDLTGAWHGIDRISEILIKDSSLYEMAYGWAHSVDITFTSRHTLKNPIFTDEVINNCKVYSDSAFSCDVAFTKNMVVNGNDQPDKMHDTLFFIKNNNEWKLINIQSVEENHE